MVCADGLRMPRSARKAANHSGRATSVVSGLSGMSAMAEQNSGSCGSAPVMVLDECGAGANTDAWVQVGPTSGFGWLCCDKG
jgi:hypothetical protein